MIASKANTDPRQHKAGNKSADNAEYLPLGMEIEVEI
jgi:hypothetical protein